MSCLCVLLHRTGGLIDNLGCWVYTVHLMLVSSLNAVLSCRGTCFTFRAGDSGLLESVDLRLVLGSRYVGANKAELVLR